MAPVKASCAGRRGALAHRWTPASTPAAAPASAAAIGLLVATGTCWGQASTTEATLHYQLSWQDIGNHNGVVEPGEWARFSLTVLMTPGVGAIIGFTGGSAATGALRGIGSGFIDLIGAGGAEGWWSNCTIDESWDLTGAGLGHGTPANGGTQLRNIQFGQFPPGNQYVNTTNPIVAVFEGTWTPTSYAPRTTVWSLSPAVPSNGVPSSVVIRPNNSGNSVELAACLSELGPPLNIPIVPAPPGAILIACGAGLAPRRPRSGVNGATPRGQKGPRHA
jgi:hypothetical protein